MHPHILPPASSSRCRSDPNSDSGPPLEHTHAHACVRTYTPTDFQNNTRLFTEPQNPERNPILPFKGRLKFSHRCCCLYFFFFKFLFHERDFSPFDPPPCLARHSPSSPRTFSPHPSVSVPVITGRKVSPTAAGRRLFKKLPLPSQQGVEGEKEGRDVEPERQVFGCHGNADMHAPTRQDVINVPLKQPKEAISVAPWQAREG